MDKPDTLIDGLERQRLSVKLESWINIFLIKKVLSSRFGVA